MADKPTILRWIFKPSDGTVIISHNQNTHPAHHKTHQDLAAEANEHGCVHGYAFLVHGGYRILDYSHEPKVDAFISKAVQKKIKETVDV